MKTHIIRNNRGRAGWSDMYCGLIGWMDNHSSDHFVSGSAMIFEAFGLESDVNDDTRSWCKSCLKLCLLERSQRT